MTNGSGYREDRPVLRLPELGREPGEGIRLPRALVVVTGVIPLAASVTLVAFASDVPLGQDISGPGWIEPGHPGVDAAQHSGVEGAAGADVPGGTRHDLGLSHAAGWPVRFPVSRADAERVQIGDTVQIDLLADQGPQGRPLLGVVVEARPDPGGGGRVGAGLELIAEVLPSEQEDLLGRLRWRFPVTIRVPVDKTGLSSLVRQGIARMFSR